MNIWFFVVGIILIAVIYKLCKEKIVIRFDTFFRKGFKRIKDKYGVYCFCR